MFSFVEDMFFPREAAVKMESKVLDFSCLGERLIAEVDRRARSFAVGKCDVIGFSLICF